MSFTNAGTVQLLQGSLKFPNGFGNGGTFALSTNTTVNLDGGVFTFGPASLKTGSGQLLVDDGYVTLNGTVPSLSWTGGNIAGSSFTVATNALLAISGSAGKFLYRSSMNNAGTITWNGTGQLAAAMDGYSQRVLITNLAGALFDIQNDSTVGYFDPAGYGGFAEYRFHNAGTLRKSAGTGATTFATQCSFLNSGNILVQQGSLIFPGFRNDGTLSVQSGGATGFPLGFVNDGTFDLAANAQANSTGGACSFGPGSQLSGSGHWVIPSGDVTLAGPIPSLTWQGGRLVGSAFTLTTNAVLTIGGAEDKFLLRSTLNNAGTITWVGAGRLVATMDNWSQSVLITNLAGALFDIQSDSSLAYSDPAGYGMAAYCFHNAGTLRKSAGTGTNGFDAFLSFTNAGTVQLLQGSLKFPNGFGNGGTFALSTNTTVNLDGGVFSFGPASLKTGSGQLLVDDGYVTLIGTVPSLSWTGGNIAGSSFTVASNAVLAISGSAGKFLYRSTMNNAGTITWSGTGQLAAAMDGYGQRVLITNLAGALFDIQNDSTVGYLDPGGYDGFAEYRFHNAGTLRKSAGTGATTFATQCFFLNSGNILIQQGSVIFPGFCNDGTLSVQSGGAAGFPLGFVNNGTFDLAANAQANSTGGTCSFGPGSQLLGSGHWVIPSGDVTLTGPIPSLTWQGGRLVGSAFTVTTNALLSIGGAEDKFLLRSMLNNGGTITWAGAGRLIATMDNWSQSVLITNLAGALFDIQSDSSLAYSDPAGYGMAAYCFHNAGTLRKSAGTGTTILASQCAFINAGLFQLRSGTFRFDAPFTQTASGVLGLKDLNPTATQPRLFVGTTANLDGTLDLGVLPGTASVGQTFSPMIFLSRTGAFSQTTGLVLGGGLWLRSFLSAYDLSLTVEGPPKVLSLEPAAEGFKLGWQGEPGVTYQVLASTNLVDWQVLHSTNTSDGFFQFVDSEFLTRPRRFYRATVQ